MQQRYSHHLPPQTLIQHLLNNKASLTGLLSASYPSEHHKFSPQQLPDKRRHLLSGSLILISSPFALDHGGWAVCLLKEIFQDQSIELRFVWLCGFVAGFFSFPQIVWRQISLRKCWCVWRHFTSRKKNSSVTLLALNHSLSSLTDNLEFIQRVHTPYCVQEQTFSKEMFLNLNDSFVFSNQLHVYRNHTEFKIHLPNSSNATSYVIFSDAAICLILILRLLRTSLLSV